MRPTRTTRDARLYYFQHKKFQSLFKKFGNPVFHEKALKAVNANILKDSLYVFMNVARHGVFAIMALLGLSLISKWVSFAWALGGIIVCSYSLVALSTLLERRRQSIIAKHQSALNAAFDQDTLIINRIEESWDEYCVNYSDYPPDWKYRRKYVLERDGKRCTKCGWPEGVQRKVRELHVHHKQRLSSGGTNAFPNLETLCDICHRGEEGVGHRRINPRRRKRPPR